MASAAGTTCVACGSDAELMQCGKCAERLKGKGTVTAICKICFGDDQLLDSVGVRAASVSSTNNEFHCRPCAIFVKRLLDEQLIDTVGGDGASRRAENGGAFITLVPDLASC